MVGSLLEWLSSPENPPVRYLTALNLAPQQASARARETLRREMLAWEPLKKVLALQLEDGSFPSLEKTPTASPTYAALCLMERCGMDITDEPVARALAYVADRHAKKGAFSYTTGACGILPCYVGIATAALIRMGACNAPAVQASVQWIVDHQRFDHKATRAGGAKEWPYSAPRHARCWESVSCYHGVVATFRALAALPTERRSPEVRTRLGQAIQYLRVHRGYKKSKEDKPLFRHMTQFFIFGSHRSNLIDVLEGIADAEPQLIQEVWVREAVEVVDPLADSGKIVLVKNYPTKLIAPFPFEPTGQPSRFLTYQWLRVKQKFGLCLCGDPESPFQDIRGRIRGP